MEDKERYSVVYIYIDKFEYKIKMVGEQFNFEPQQGKVYRCVYDKKGKVWRLPISDVKGMVFSNLEEDNEAFNCRILEFNYDNIKDITLPEEEIEKVIEWESNPELNEKYLDVVLDLMNKDQKIEDNEVTIELDEEHEGIIVPDNFDAVAVKEVMGDMLRDFMSVLEGRDGVALTIADLLEYLATTYSDKYTDTLPPLDTKRFLYHHDHGTAVNMFCASKYMQRYMTKGYAKSNNPIDLFKAIHYLLFELSRVKISEDVRERKNKELTRGAKKPDMGSKDGGKDTPKATKKRRGRPRKGSEGR